jgi:hypothetical protein
MKNRSALAAGLAAGIAALGLAASSAGAQTIPNCGGQGAARHDASVAAPYVCNLPGIDITQPGPNGPVTRHFAAQVTVNGIIVSVTFKMTGGVLPVKVPVGIVHHFGVSGNPCSQPGDCPNASGNILPGQTTATVTDSKPCQDGQLDVKAVDISPSSGDTYRVGGPWILNGLASVCLLAPPPGETTVPTTAPATTVPATTVPGEATSIPASTGPTTTAARVSPGGTLPPTGSNDGPPAAAIAVLAFAVGTALIAFTRNPRKV